MNAPIAAFLHSPAPAADVVHACLVMQPLPSGHDIKVAWDGNEYLGEDARMCTDAPTASARVHAGQVAHGLACASPRPSHLLDG